MIKLTVLMTMLRFGQSTSSPPSDWDRGSKVEIGEAKWRSYIYLIDDVETSQYGNSRDSLAWMANRRKGIRSESGNIERQRDQGEKERWILAKILFMNNTPPHPYE